MKPDLVAARLDLADVLLEAGDLHAARVEYDLVCGYELPLLARQGRSEEASDALAKTDELQAGTGKWHRDWQVVDLLRSETEKVLKGSGSR